MKYTILVPGLIFSAAAGGFMSPDPGWEIGSNHVKQAGEPTPP